MSQWKYFDPRKMTLQEIVTASVNHVLSQGEPASSTEWGDCIYRTEDGLQCAASIFISDEEYDEGFEGFYFPDTIYLESKEKTRLIRILQECHDESASIFYDEKQTKEEFLEEYKKHVSNRLKWCYNNKFIMPFEQQSA